MLEMIARSQYFAYFLYILAGFFLIHVVRNFLRRRIRKMVWFLIASVVSSGSGHALQQSVIHNASQYAVQHVESYVGNRLAK